MLPTVNRLIGFVMRHTGGSVALKLSAFEEMRRAVRPTFLEDLIYDLKEHMPDHNMSGLLADDC
jgi:hypothetical protein